jgi:hypothetical protein
MTGSDKPVRSKPIARINSPLPFSSPAPRPSLPNNAKRPSFVKFGDLSRKTDRSRKRVKVVMTTPDPPTLAVLDLPIDTSHLLSFFGDLCGKWQLWHLRAEVLDLVSWTNAAPSNHYAPKLYGPDAPYLSVSSRSSRSCH